MIEQIKSIFREAAGKRHLGIRAVISLLSVIFMAFSMSLLILCNFGTDPCTLFERAAANRAGLSFGTWHALANIFLYVIVIRFGAKNLGIGTLFNMLLPGYIVDFCSILWKKLIPSGLLPQMSFRIGLLIPSLILFCLSVAMYMDVDMGITPFDAIPYMISDKLPKVPFRIVRIAFDFTVTFLGMILGGKAGLLTALLVLLLGPAISGLNTVLVRHVPLFNDF